MGSFALASKFEANDWALVREAALLLVAGGRAAQATEVWRILFSSAEFTDELRITWLPDAVDAANAARDAAQAGAWRESLAELTRDKR